MQNAGRKFELSAGLQTPASELLFFNSFLRNFKKYKKYIYKILIMND